MSIPLRADFDATHLRAAARQSKDAGQVRRLLALAAVYDGSTRTEAAKIDGVTLQVVRDWVLKFNARGPEGLIDRKPPGQPSRLDDMIPCCPDRRDRERANPCDTWRGALADHRSMPVDVGGISDQHHQANDELGNAHYGVSQALGAAPPSCSSGWHHRAF